MGRKKLDKTELYRDMCNTYNKLRQNYSFEGALLTMANEIYFYNYHYMRQLVSEAFKVTGIERVSKNDNWRGRKLVKEVEG